MDFGEYLTNSWENEETQPPIPHAELLTLIELAERLDDTSIEKIESKLKANNIQFNNAGQNLTEIAAMNSITPNQVYEIIIQKSKAGMPGSGIGKKTLEDIATENGKDVSLFIKLLKAQNITANKNQTLKDLANQYDMAARDLYKIILGDE